MADKNKIEVDLVLNTSKFQQSLRGVKSAGDKLASGLKTGLVAGFTAVATGATLATRSFVEYEKALIGVGKTANLEGQQLTALGTKFRKLSKEIPLTTKELLNIAESGARLGIAGKDLDAFTLSIAKIASATDLTTESAATNFARIATLTKEPIKNVGRLGSVLAQLGDNFAATESEITANATSIAQNIALYGASAEQVFALGTATRALGIQSEIAGTALGKSFNTINEAVFQGGEKLETLTRLTGKSGDELKRVFQEDSVKAFEIFTEALGKVPASKLTTELEALGLSEIRTARVLKTLAGNTDLVTRALGTAQKEFQTNTKLNTEASKAWETLGSKLQIAKNSFDDIFRVIGIGFAPILERITDAVTNLFKSFPGAPELKVLAGGIEFLFTKIGNDITIFVAETRIQFSAIKTAINQLINAFAIIETSVGSFITSARAEIRIKLNELLETATIKALEIKDAFNPFSDNSEAIAKMKEGFARYRQAIRDEADKTIEDSKDATVKGIQERTQAEIEAEQEAAQAIIEAAKSTQEAKERLGLIVTEATNEKLAENIAARNAIVTEGNQELIDTNTEQVVAATEATAEDPAIQKFFKWMFPNEADNEELAENKENQGKTLEKGNKGILSRIGTFFKEKGKQQDDSDKKEVSGFEKTQNTLLAIEQLTGDKSKKISQAVNLANAVGSFATGIVNAVKSGSEAPWPLTIPTIATNIGVVTAASLPQLAAIKGARAEGGAVTAGDAFLVGERGAEKFIPDVDGQIVPNDQLGGQNVNVMVTAGDDFTKQLVFDIRNETDLGTIAKNGGAF